MRDWLREENLAWFVPECLELMDLTPFYARYRQDGRGGAAFPPDVMVAILTYAYCTHERSSRRIERLCRRDVGYRIIAGGATPDHATLARFRREYQADMDVRQLCSQAPKQILVIASYIRKFIEPMSEGLGRETRWHHLGVRESPG